MISKNAVLILIFILNSFTSCCQIFLNGDFESNSAISDQINITNETYDSLMNHSKAFGNSDGGGSNGGNMDIISSNSYCQSGAQNGSWYIGLTGGGKDAISLELSVPLVTGQSYTISFYDQFGPQPATIIYPIQIGLSLVDSLFGSLIYTAPNPEICSWSLRNFSFIAPNNGQFITVKVSDGNQFNTWSNVDNFAFEDPTSIQNPIPDNYFQVYPNPASNEINIESSENYSQIVSLRILNINGQELIKLNYYDKINVELLPYGFYFLELKTDKFTHIAKFLKM